MNRHKSAMKAARHSTVRNEINRANKTRVRTATKVVRAEIDGQQVDSAAAKLKELIPLLDRMTHRRILHKNKAARLKSRLHKRLQAAKAS